MPNTPNADHLPQIVLPAGARTVPTMAVAALIARAFHPDADQSSTEFQAALHSHARMLSKAARDGAVQVVSFHGEPITIETEQVTGCAGAFLTVTELGRYLSTLPLPIAVRTGEPGEPAPPARAVPVAKQHESAVLTAIRAAGHDPMHLPRGRNGTRTPKAEARDQCRLTESQFDRAWKALRAGGLIKESD